MWRIRNDRIKSELMSMMRCSGLVATCEVWGLFQHLVPHDHIDRAEVNKQRKVMIPQNTVVFPHWPVRNSACRAEIDMQPRCLQARGKTKTVQEGSE